ncbi:hypothetical protein ScPMuIL_017143, partial [Solemya velum]
MRKHKCNVCGSTFTRKQAWNKHQRIQTDEKNIHVTYERWPSHREELWTNIRGYIQVRNSLNATYV